MVKACGEVGVTGDGWRRRGEVVDGGACGGGGGWGSEARREWRRVVLDLLDGHFLGFVLFLVSSCCVGFLEYWSLEEPQIWGVLRKGRERKSHGMVGPGLS